MRVRVCVIFLLSICVHIIFNFYLLWNKLGRNVILRIITNNLKKKSQHTKSVQSRPSLLTQASKVHVAGIWCSKLERGKLVASIEKVLYTVIRTIFIRMTSLILWDSFLENWRRLYSRLCILLEMIQYMERNI